MEGKKAGPKKEPKQKVDMSTGRGANRTEQVIRRILKITRCFSSGMRDEDNAGALDFTQP